MASAQPPAEPQNSGNTTTVRTTQRFNIDGVGARVIRGLTGGKKYFLFSKT